VRGRFFNNLEQSVEALLGDHVGFVDNVDLEAIPRGGKGGPFAQVTGIINATMGRCVDFNDIQGTGAAAR
jgi:hypothetical protein